MRERKQKESIQKKLLEDKKHQNELDSKFMTNEEEKLRIKVSK